MTKRTYCIFDIELILIGIILIALSAVTNFHLLIPIILYALFVIIFFEFRLYKILSYYKPICFCNFLFFIFWLVLTT